MLQLLGKVTKLKSTNSHNSSMSKHWLQSCSPARRKDRTNDREIKRNQKKFALMKISFPFSYLFLFLLLNFYLLIPTIQFRSGAISFWCDKDCENSKSYSNTHIKDVEFRELKKESKVETPAPLSEVHNIPHHKIPTLAGHSFLLPRVFKSYVRPSLNRTSTSPNAVDVFLFTIGFYARNLSVSHCLIGNQIYPAQSYFHEVTLCTIPSLSIPLATGSDDVITVIIDRNSKGIHAAFSNNIPLPAGYEARRLIVGRDVKPHRISSTTQNVVVPAQPVAKNMDVTASSNVVLSVPSNESLSSIAVDDFDPNHAHTQKRYAVCMGSMTSTSPHLLPSWVDYHRTVGVDHVYIFDNGLKTNLSVMFANRSDVEVVPWPWQKTQTQAISFMIISARRRCQILFKPDTDEYVLFGLLPDKIDSSVTDPAFGNGRRPLHAFLQNRKKRHEKSGIQVRSFKLCNAGYIATPSGPPPILYTFARQDHRAYPGKTFCDTMLDYRSGSIHPCGLVSSKGNMVMVPSDFGYPEFLELPRKYPNTQWFMDNFVSPSSVSDPAWLMHFYERSWEEWTEKWSVGRAGILGGLGRDEMINRHNASEPDPEFIDTKSSRCTKYTFFSDVFKSVMLHKRERLRESVLVWNVQNSTYSVIVSV